MDHTRRHHEAAAILMAAVAGEAPEADLVRLNQWLEDDPALAEFVVDMMNQESWLSWQGALADTVPALAEHAPRVLASSLSPEAPAAKQPRASAAVPAPPRDRRPSLALAASLLIAIGAALGAIAMRWSIGRDAAPDFVAAPPDSADPAASRYVARFVEGTACLWNSETTAPFGVDDRLRTGESLNLLEGLAEVQFDWRGGSANLKLEGPAGLVLTAERGANLSRGRLTADVELDEGRFVLETPNGEIEATGDATLGVAVRGDVVELHVFSGAATYVAPWPNAEQPNERLNLVAGEAVTVASDAEGRSRLDCGAALPEDFASQISMGSDDLPISQEYVEEVLAAKPLVYWRFEGDENTTVRNEMGDRYHGRVVGAVKWANQGGNKNVDLGAGLTAEELHAYIMAAEPLAADLRAGYSIEMWIKPSHYHWGTVASLIGAPLEAGRASVHGMLFELGGPTTYVSSIEQPGKFRFLHRSPPSDDLAQGTSCFSGLPYELRHWQHVAAVKDGAEMRLYVDGRLVATDADASELPTGLSLIVGQLDEVRVDRRFVGQLDELALYPRALTAEEIQRRYDLVRKPPSRPVRTVNRSI